MNDGLRRSSVRSAAFQCARARAKSYKVRTEESRETQVQGVRVEADVVNFPLLRLFRREGNRDNRDGDTCNSDTLHKYWATLTLCHCRGRKRRRELEREKERTKRGNERKGKGKDAAPQRGKKIDSSSCLGSAPGQAYRDLIHKANFWLEFWLEIFYPGKS